MTDWHVITTDQPEPSPIPSTVVAGVHASATKPHDVGALEALAMRLAGAIDVVDSADDLTRLAQRFVEVARILGWGPVGVSTDDRRPVAVLSDLGGPTLRNRS